MEQLTKLYLLKELIWGKAQKTPQCIIEKWERPLIVLITSSCGKCSEKMGMTDGT